MMGMVDNSRLDLGASCCEASGMEEDMGTHKISLLDHINGFQYTTAAAGNSENFVIDMDTIPHGTSNKDINPNSRITFHEQLQRSLSRKGSQRGGSEKKANSSTCANDRESIVAASSPRGPSMPEKAAVVVPIGNADHCSSPQVHHQITITTGNTNAPTEGRSTARRNSFKRPTPSWVLDPKRILLLFATLSSIGTMLLIYFTLSIGKINAEDNVH